MVLPTRRRAKHPVERLTNTPLDVLIEIFVYLGPLDLLHLARTTKGLRRFLLDRKRASLLWKNAISNVKDFPPCPDHMSPPAYTHLAFVPVCHRCFCLCETIEWELRMRCCSDCFPNMTILRITATSACSYLNDLDPPKAHKHYKLDYDSYLNVVVSQEYIHPAHSVFLSLLDWKAIKSRKGARNAAFEEFLAQQNDCWGSIQKHAHLCRQWERERLTKKANQLSFVREQRAKDIEDKLKELGWTDTDSCSSRNHTFLYLPEVRKFEPLTPTEWTKICPQVIDWARKAKKDFHWNFCLIGLTAVSLTVQEGLERHNSLKVLPREIDVAMLPAMRSLLEGNINLPGDYDELKKRLLRVLPPAIRKWSSSAVEELEQIAREQLNLPPLLKTSCLPSVIFRCQVCCSRSVKRHSRLTFVEALSHDHLWKHLDERENNCKVSLRDMLVLRYYMHPRDTRILRVDVTVSRRVENLIKRMGQNPSRVTYDELRRSTVKVVCSLCRPQVATRMNFDDALCHCLNTHLRAKETEVWTRASARE